MLTTPVLRLLKLELGAEIHTLVKGSFKSVLEHNPYVDKQHVLDSTLQSTLFKLKAENYDRIIDLQHNLRSLIISMRLRVPVRRVNKLNLKKWLLVNFKINTLPDLHIVDRYLATCSDLGVKNDQKGLDYFLPSNAKECYKNLQTKFNFGHNPLCIAIGAAHFTKRIPLTKVVEICNLTQGQILLLGGPSDEALGTKLVAASSNKSIINLAGKTSLNESAIILSQASLLVTPDTGLMHIGAALHLPMVTVWGNTVPQFGMYPYEDSSQYHIIENTQLNCRPCSKIGHKKCPKGHFKCMNDIQSQAIVEKMQSFIEI